MPSYSIASGLGQVGIRGRPAMAAYAAMPSQLQADVSRSRVHASTTATAESGHLSTDDLAGRFALGSGYEVIWSCSGGPTPACRSWDAHEWALAARSWSWSPGDNNGADR